jgi:hypothetical protein
VKFILRLEVNRNMKKCDLLPVQIVGSCESVFLRVNSVQ